MRLFSTKVGAESACRTALVMSAAALIVLSACAGGSGDVDNTTSVEPGASKEEYIAALEDMEPVELVFQLPTAPDNIQSRTSEAYAEAVTEWSGGKITFEMLYSSSRVSLPEMPDALADGIVDLGTVLPGAAPERFPAFTWAADLMFLHEASPIFGSLQSVVASWENGYAEEAVLQDYVDNGLQPLVPMMGTGPAQGVMCADGPVSSLSDFRGKTFRSGTASHSRQIEALGGTTVSLPILETYEGLQRGVIDCAVGSLAMAEIIGAFEVTDTYMLDSEVMFTMTPDAFAIGQDVWDDLPLAARQLMWDRLDVYLAGYLNNNTLENMRLALIDADEAGVELLGWDDEVRGVLADFLNAELESARDDAPDQIDADAYVAQSQEVHERWLTFVREDMELTGEIEWADFGAWLSDGDFDTQPLIDEFVAQVLLPGRPS